jgi:anti-anti-sigma factor
MQITVETVGGIAELRLEGRLDNEAADDLLAVVDDVLRRGHQAALLDMQAVGYVSSAGLGALVRAQKKFQAIHGSFGVAGTSPQAAEVLQLTGLAKLLVCDPEKVREKYVGIDSTVQPTFRVAAADGLGLAIFDLRPEDKLRCRVWGDAGQLTASPSSKSGARPVPFAGDSFGLGIGAFGRDHADCAARFGEFVAAAGGVAVQPTPEGGKPDYQVASGGFVPQPQLLYGLSLSGDFTHMIRFESEEAEGRAGLSALAGQCLQLSGARVAGVVIVAETAGLIGATLRRSPAVAGGASGVRFSHPEIRQWLSFTPERVFPRSLVVVAGVIAQGSPSGSAAALAPLVRPLSPKSEVHGHFHAAVFSYRPLKKRRLNLQEMVQSLFDSEDLQAVLHLLHDDREISGSGESELTSGVCWVGPIAEMKAEAEAL